MNNDSVLQLNDNANQFSVALAYNQKEAARLCGISVQTLWRDTKLGRVRRTDRGVYPRVELERYLAAGLVDDEFAALQAKARARRAR